MDEIRSADVRDTEAIVRIYVDSWNQGFGARMPVIAADEARLGRWREDLGASTPTRWWLLERDSLVLGFVGIGPSRDPVDGSLGELDTIAVSPNAWRGGVGSTLMCVALEKLRESDYHHAILWTLADYPLGESFYVAHGWYPSGATRNDGDQVRYDHEL